MAIQTLHLGDKPFVVMPQAEYEDLVARAAGEALPSLPPPDADGNYPAKEAVRVLIARDMITRRIAAGWTQEELAKRARTSAETISRLEGAKHKPQAATLEKIDAVFKKAGV